MAIALSVSRPVLLRTGGFLVFQIVFLCLAFVCAHTPLPINLTSTSSEVRGAFSVVFVAWQFVAALLVTDLLLRVFSEEWSFYLTRHPFQPGCDAVSTLTANVFFHAKHTLTRSTSLAYKGACSALVLITILRTIGAASITTAIGPRASPGTIGLAKFIPTTFDPTNRDDPVMTSIYRAEIITRIEQEMKMIVGWNVTDNMLIGTQEKASLTPNITTIYPSDIVKFDFRCSWLAPQVQQDENGLLLFGNGTQWRVWNAHNASDITVGIYTLYNSSKSFIGQSAYLFVGCNSTDQRPPCLLELSDLPTTSIPTPPPMRVTIPAPATLSTSLLSCDPNYHITTSRVVASGTTLGLVPGSESLPTQNNLPRTTTELILSSALLGVMSPLSTSPGLKPNLVSTAAARVFLDSQGQDVQDWIRQMNFTANILALDAIQRNLNSAMVSASKSFLMGPRGQNINDFAGFETFTVPATVEQHTILLVGSKSFIFSTIGLLVLIIICSSLIILDVQTHQRLPLNLQTVLDIFGGRPHSSVLPPIREKSAQNKPLPLILGTYHPLSVDDDGSDDETEIRENDGRWYWPRRYVVARVVLFLILQLSFYGFAIAGHVRPFNISKASPLNLTDYSAELKGAFIIAFTAWHTLSIALLNDIIFTIFSLEWVVQAEKKCILKPGQTDQVSTPASGLFDRVKYAFGRGQGASGMFRYALAASITLMVIAATGPGCFTLSTTAAVNQNITLVSSNLAASRAALITPVGFGPVTDQQAALLDRIASIVHVEQIEGFTWGYEVPTKTFISWRYRDSGSIIHDQATVRYGNYTRHFNANCRWETPSTEALEVQSDITQPITGGVVPVTFKNTTRTNLGHSGLLLVGCEDTGNANCRLNMTGVQGSNTDSNGLWKGTAALLACDASDTNFSFSSSAAELSFEPSCAQITITNGRISTKNQGCSSAGLGDYRPPDFFGTVYASSLLFALRPPSLFMGNSTPGDVGIGMLAGHLLFDDFMTSLDSNASRAVSQIQMFEVESKMNEYLTSATKIVMAGYDPQLDIPTSQNFFRLAERSIGTITTTVDQITLVGNKAMIISSMILLAISLRFLELSLRSVFWKQSRLRLLEPFGIAGVVKMKKWLENVERLRREEQDVEPLSGSTDIT